MVINFNQGDKVIINQSFVNNTLATRTPTSARKALLEHLGRLGTNLLCVSRTYNFPLIKVTVIESPGSIQSPSLIFESEDDLNSTFTLVEKFTSRSFTINAKNNDNLPIGPGQFVTLVGYEGTNPEIPIITAPDQKELETLPIFGITTQLIAPGSAGQVLVEGFYGGLPAKGTTLLPNCYVETDNEVIQTMPGAIYRETGITVDPSQNGLLYLPKQPGGPYKHFEIRAFSGKGNNKNNTSWGHSNSNLTRWGKASYPNSKSMMPRLPNARHISNTIFSQTTNKPNSKNITDYLWVWGQFLSHDLGLNISNPAEPANIELPAGDSHFPGTILFNRSSYDPTTGTTNVRQQINSQSSYIDASNIYGSNVSRAMALRLPPNTPGNSESGKLKCPGGFLPKNTQLFTNYPNNHDPQYYFAGDPRANEHLNLLALHTLWVREHNRIAAEISSNNSHLTGDQIYYATRRKVIALNQAITFNEYLPLLLGTIPEYTGYNAEVNSSISNEFLACFSCFDISMVPERIQRLDNNLATIVEGSTSFRDSYFRPDRLLEGGGIEPLLRGAARQVCQNVDLNVVDELRNLSNNLDLVAMAIQRGRDHGLPSYNDTRVALGLSARRSYSQISSDPAIVSKLVSVYTNINEIDLWVGMLAEDHLTGSLIGETLREGLLKQFIAIRDGDRFWYENIFAGELLDEINNTKLSDVIRRNTTISSEIQDNVFIL